MNTYDAYFSSIESEDASKLVIVIDEAQFVLKRDEAFLKSILKLKAERLYQGHVFIILASSSIVWVEQELGCTFGEAAKKIDGMIKIGDFKFLEVVRAFPSLPVSECIKIYGAIGGVPGYMQAWNPRISFKENICNLVLTEGGCLIWHRD